MQRASVLKQPNRDVIVVYVRAGAIGGQPTNLWRTTSSARGSVPTVQDPADLGAGTVPRVPRDLGGPLLQCGPVHERG